jgi:hypothetical protein
MVVEILFVVLGYATILLLGSFLVADRNVIADRPVSSEPVDVLTKIGLKLLPRELVARIFSESDWDFLANQSSVSLRRIVDHERRELLRVWLRWMRRQIDLLMNFHRRTLRPYLGSNLASELRLAGYFALFQILYISLRYCTLVGGPREITHLGLCLAEIAWRLEREVKERLGGLETVALHRMLRDFGQSGATSKGELRSWPADRVKNLEVEAAVGEFRRRELSGRRSEFLGLTFISSTRDYNSGRYYHEDLARRFSEQTMERALAICHEEIFERLLYIPLEEFVSQLETYVKITPETPANIIRAWCKLEPYRVLMPMNSDRLSADLFISNVRIALAILQDRFQSRCQSCCQSPAE